MPRQTIVNRLHLGQISGGLFNQGSIISLQERRKIKKNKTKNNWKQSQCWDGPLRRGWVTGLREDVPQAALMKRKKGAKKAARVRVDYSAIFRSLLFLRQSARVGSFIRVWKMKKWSFHRVTRTFPPGFTPPASPSPSSSSFCLFSFACPESSTSSSKGLECATGCTPRKSAAHIVFWGITSAVEPVRPVSQTCNSLPATLFFGGGWNLINRALRGKFLVWALSYSACCLLRVQHNRNPSS